jgi:hypothetical protein
MLKTAVILSHASGLKMPLPRVHLQFLKDNPSLLPAGIGIFASMQSPTHQFSYLQRNYWVNVDDARMPETREMRDTAPVGNEYKLTIQLYHLLLMAAYLPSSSAQFMLASGLHVPIWPPDTVLPCYRAGLTIELPYDSIKMTTLFNNTLGVIRPAKKNTDSR